MEEEHLLMGAYNYTKQSSTAVNCNLVLLLYLE